MAEKMNPEIKADWVKSLRSGEYQQGVGALRLTFDRERRFCCLGVLADRAVLAGVVPGWQGHDSSPEASIYGEWQVLPEAVGAWAGLWDTNPLVRVAKPSEDYPWTWSERTESLAELNDDGLTFAEIADLIEEQL